MSVITNHSRRQFLRGAGGFALALPWLPSLLPSSAKAQSFVALPRFVAITSPHGAVTGANFFPSDSLLTESQALYSDHTVRRGNLATSSSGGKASLSNILNAASANLSSSVLSRINVIRGFDLPFYIAHHTGGHLGNFGRSDQNPPINYVPTIDQVMAWSPSFYSNLSSIKQRSMHIATDGISWNYSNPQTKSGSVQSMPTSFSSKELFDSIFVPPTTTTSARVPVVDRVLDNYKQLRNGAFGDAKRLSAADKQRLDDHMARLSELERRVNVVASCSNVQAPGTSVDKNSSGFGNNSTNVAGSTQFYDVFNDVIAAAFMCGTSRICTMYTMELWTAFNGDWHQDVAHQATNPDKQALLVASYQHIFENVFLDLANKLNVEEADGKTYLDNTLMMWTQESGESTHDPVGLPLVTAGGAAGFLKTGNYVDYRAVNSNRKWRDQFAGLLYNQWLATVLQAMGVPASEFESGGLKGYGSQFTDNSYGDPKTMWPDRLRTDASKIVPFLKA
ncbi:MAG: DUF1552 domain-containing protein [Myxococcales bacterium]